MSPAEASKRSKKSAEEKEEKHSKKSEDKSAKKKRKAEEAAGARACMVAAQLVVGVGHPGLAQPLDIQRCFCWNSCCSVQQLRRAGHLGAGP